MSIKNLPPLPEPTYYAAADIDTKPALLHDKTAVLYHLKSLEKLGGAPVPWEGNVHGLFTADQMLAYAIRARGKE